MVKTHTSRRKLNFETRIVTTPLQRKDAFGAIAMPVYHTAAYQFETAQDMDASFQGRLATPAYSRSANPTVQYLEERVRLWTDALSVSAFNTGMAAINTTFLTLGMSGKNVVTSTHLFGNTASLFNSTLSSFGLEVRQIDLLNLPSVEAAIDANTCALFLEVVTNPQMEVADLKALAGICKQKHIPLIADTTAVPFSEWHARDFGVDIEIVSSTKYISGGGTCLGGLVIDYGRFDYSNMPALSKYLALNGPKAAFTMRLKRETITNLGGYMTPHAAYMQTLGLETLGLRYRRQAETALELACRLEQLSAIIAVRYPLLPNSPFRQVAQRQFGPTAGAMITIDLSSAELCDRFLNRLKVFRRATNLFDNRSLAIRPWGTIFAPFTDSERYAMDVLPTTVRLSIGLEDVEELYEDIVQALA